MIRFLTTCTGRKTAWPLMRRLTSMARGAKVILSTRERLHRAVASFGFDVDVAIESQRAAVLRLRDSFMGRASEPSAETWKKYDSEVAYLDALMTFKRYRVIS